jgi:hypothetical protein
MVFRSIIRASRGVNSPLLCSGFWHERTRSKMKIGYRTKNLIIFLNTIIRINSIKSPSFHKEHLDPWNFLKKYYPILLAFFSFLYSISLWFTGNELEGLYVGLWPVTILAFAIAIRQRRNDDKNQG